jgi:hypothetical protein
MNSASRWLYLNHSAILGGIVIFTALSCDLNNPLSQDAGTSKDAGTGQDTGHTCSPLGGACQMCPNGYLTDANGCATCQCKPPTTCGPVCAIYCAYGNVPDAQGCPTCACNPPPNGSCSTAECGPVPPVVPQICPDGKTVAEVTCLRDQTGVCGWRGLTCPPPLPTCAADQCPSPRPAGPNALCPDGKTVSGPACLPTANGSCGWTQVTCPPTCVDTVLCVQGAHWDSTLCKCVPNPPTPAPCPCPAGQICVTQIGGPAISDPPPSQCEAPDQMCLQRVDTVNPCACLAASDGKCTSSSTGNCTCDNGIR